MRHTGSRDRFRDPRQLGWIVLGVALLSTAAKLVIAARTFGTNDVHYWEMFGRAVRDHGPVGIYGTASVIFYNHPPLVGWLLVGVNRLVDLGLPFPFVIRVPACLADAGSAVLLFDLLRRRGSPRQAAVAAVLFAVSPVMVIVSGFHGNTDPVFTFACLLVLHLLTVRRQHLGAGLAFGVAVSIKLVPVVLVPVLVVLLVRRGLGPTLRFAVGGALVFLVLWVPVLVLRGPEFTQQVLGYSGVALSQWGLPEFVDLLGASGAQADGFRDAARFVALPLAALIPAVVLWRRPQAVTAAFGLCLCLFLLLSPAFGMQYLVWPLAAAYLVDWRTATVYNVAAGALAYVVYADWNGGRWWHWHEAVALPFTWLELLLMTLTWAALLLVVVHGVVTATRAARPQPVP